MIPAQYGENDDLLFFHFRVSRGLNDGQFYLTVKHLRAMSVFFRNSNFTQRLFSFLVSFLQYRMTERIPVSIHPNGLMGIM